MLRPHTWGINPRKGSQSPYSVFLTANSGRNRKVIPRAHLHERTCTSALEPTQRTGTSALTGARLRKRACARPCTRTILHERACTSALLHEHTCAITVARAQTCTSTLVRDSLQERLKLSFKAARGDRTRSAKMASSGRCARSADFCCYFLGCTLDPLWGSGWSMCKS